MKNKITYHREGDYLIPNIIIGENQEEVVLGKYGRERLKVYKRK